MIFYGFAKNNREKLEPGELITARRIAALWLAADDKQIALSITENEIQEIFRED